MSPIQELKGILEENKKLSQKYLENADVVYEEIYSVLTDHAPQFMVYGSYNAGKSSFINTLLGKEQAKVRDIPTTDRIDIYDWKGVQVLDTPGVDAPIEHEEATEEQLKKSSMILFIVRQGDQDSKAVYERLFDFIQRKKKIFILLNMESDSEVDIRKAHEKMIQILNDFALKKNVELDLIKEISVIPVNVKDALEGKLEEDEELIDESGFNVFLEHFNLWLNGSQTENEKFVAIKNQITETLITPLLNKVELNLSGTKNNDLEGLLRRKEVYLREKSLLINKANLWVQNEARRLKGEVSSTLMESVNEIAFEKALQKVQDQLVTTIEQRLTEEVEDLNIHIDFHADVVNKTNKKEPKEDDLFGKFSSLAGGAIKQNIQKEQFVGETLKLGRRLKLPGLKGRWDKTLGKWAKKAGPYIQVAISALEAASANSIQNKENKAERDRALSIFQQAQQITDSIASQLIKTVSPIIDEIFKENIDQIQDQIDTESKNLNSAEVDFNLVKDFKMKVDLLNY